MSYITYLLSSCLYFGSLTSCVPSTSKNPQVQNKINVTAGSILLIELLLLVPEVVLVLADGLTSDTEGSS